MSTYFSKMTYTDKMKAYLYKWREENPDKYKSYVRKSALKHYNETKGQLKYYYWKKERMAFLNILLPENI